jgi:hypothetical protein
LADQEVGVFGRGYYFAGVTGCTARFGRIATRT